MQVQAYLFFEGRCEEAMDFYRSALGAEVLFVMKMKDSPGAHETPAGAGEKILHATMKIGATNVMVSDGHCSGKPSFEGFCLSLDATDPAHAARLFSALGKGGQVRMPLEKTFWSPCFGMVADRFGVLWMVSVHEADLAP